MEVDEDKENEEVKDKVGCSKKQCVICSVALVERAGLWCNGSDFYLQISPNKIKDLAFKYIQCTIVYLGEWVVLISHKWGEESIGWFNNLQLL